MPIIDQFLRVSEVYEAACSLSGARVSTLVFNDGKRLARIRAGGDLGTRSYERAMQWFSDHWPEGAEWPEDVPRPEPVPLGTEAAVARRRSRSSDGPASGKPLPLDRRGSVEGRSHRLS